MGSGHHLGCVRRTIEQLSEGFSGKGDTNEPRGSGNKMQCEKRDFWGPPKIAQMVAIRGLGGSIKSRIKHIY